MLTARDIFTYKGEPVLCRLEKVWDETIEVDGVDVPNCRDGWGLAITMPGPMREQAIRRAQAYAESMFHKTGMDKPDDFEEQIERMAERMPEFALLDHPMTLCWN